MPSTAASHSDIRLVGSMLHVLMQCWASAIGGRPSPASPLASDLELSATYATARYPDPFSQSWAFAQTLGLVATNHEALLRESLLNYANGQTQTKPVTSVTTMTRVIMETLGTQAWLVDPSVDARERFCRWMFLDFESEVAAWRVVHPGRPRMENPMIRGLVENADRFGIPRDARMSPQWIGTEQPTATALAGRLLQVYADHAQTRASEIDGVGELFYRLFSGEIHGSVGSVLQLLLPTGNPSSTGRPVHVYDLSHGALWRSAAITFMATFAARANYASWLGRSIEPETRRIHLHHVQLAIRQLG